MLLLGSKGFRFWRITNEMTKNGCCDELTIFDDFAIFIKFI